MPKFDHLLPADAALWDLFLHQYPNRYTQLHYDVRIGTGRDPGPEFPDNIRYMAISLSQRRIDVLAFTADHIDIIEITTAAGLTALGQLLAYPQLYIATYSPTLPVRPLLVTYQFQPDIKQIYIDNDIPFIIIDRPRARTL